jgi:hypothetical protein
MAFVERELSRVSARLRAGTLPDDKRAQLYAVQQALAWALEPDGFKAPYDLVIAPSTPEGSEDCPALLSPGKSL